MQSKNHLTRQTIYTIRRGHLLQEISFWRQRGHAAQSLMQLRMELAALRSCRALVGA